MHSGQQQYIGKPLRQTTNESKMNEEHTTRNAPLVFRMPNRLKDKASVGRDTLKPVCQTASDLPQRRGLFQNKPNMLKVPQKILPMFFSFNQQRKSNTISFEAAKTAQCEVAPNATPQDRQNKQTIALKRQFIPKGLKEYLSPHPTNSRLKIKKQPQVGHIILEDKEADVLPKASDTSLVMEKITMADVSPKHQDSLYYNTATIKTDERLRKYTESPSKVNHDGRNRTLVSHPSQSHASKNPESPYNRMNWFLSTSISHSRQSSVLDRRT